MAPTAMEGLVAKRQFYSNNCNSSYYNCNSGWDNWGRWVALGVIIAAFILLAFLFSCYNNRRRRNRGAPPMYGTGWIPYGYPKHGVPQNQNYYAPQPYNTGAPAPPYSPPIATQGTGTTFNSNDGYYGHHGYGGQQSGIELQQPSSAYQPQRGGDPVYDAPEGPPPTKGDYVVR